MVRKCPVKDGALRNSYLTVGSISADLLVRNLDEVKDCDVLLVSHMSRINRDYIKYLQAVRYLRDKGIKIESVLSATKNKENKLKSMGFTEVLKLL